MLKSNKVYSNEELAEYLTNIATAYEIKNKNYFRILSYKNAADTIASYPKPIQKLWEKDPSVLDELPSIGVSILEKLDYLLKNNDYHPSVKKAFAHIHPAVFTFTKINSVGPKIAHKLTKNLKFPEDSAKALDKLIFYAKNGRIRTIESFGERSEKSILENTLNFIGRVEKMPLEKAEKVAADVIKFLKKKFPDVEFMPLGSLRRCAALVGDIDIAAQSENSHDILDHFISYPDSIQTIARGPKKASIRIRHDIRVDLMVQPKDTWGSLLQHFTGSRQHNVELRKYAQNLGFSLSEYGIKDLRTGKIHNFENEEKFYNFLKLAYIPPEKRLGENEIENAKKWYTKN